MTRGDIMIRRRVVALCVVAATVFGACTSTDPDVSGGRSTQHQDGQPPVTPTVTVPAGTDPAGTEPAGTDSGVSGVGDALFADLGNPGIDVDHYDIDLTFDHRTARISAVATLTITASAALAAFTLDALGLEVSTVTVDGTNADFAVDDPELRITPPSPIAIGETFDVAVTYRAEGNDGTISAGVSAGWFETPSGSFVLDEPDGARTWLPSNDHPSDKATYHFTIHLPPGETAVANGALVSHTTTADGETWIWDQPEPMTTYLIQLSTGPLEIVTGTAPNGVPMLSALQEGDQADMQQFIDLTGRQLDFFDDWFGPYPFDSYGITMTDGYIGGAMEEQGRSLFSRSDFAGGQPDESTELLLSHELTHQWFGDAVSPSQWRDIWLNESFATYGEWMWLEHAGYGTVDAYAARALGRRKGSDTATGSPTADGLFSFEVYEGGAVVLQALRKTVGDDAFFAILRRWVQDNLDTSRSSRDFIELSSSVAGRDLTGFFDTWLYSARVPDQFPS